MSEEQLKNLLFKLSVMVIHRLGKGSIDPISIQESIERISHTRPIIFSTQIINVKSFGDCEKEITFVLSPDFLNANRSLALQGGLDRLSWTYKLPEYDYGDDEILLRDAESQISMRSEEGVVEWLVRGSIELVDVSESIYALDFENLHQSVMSSNGY